jgi:hypothetical protein
MNPNEEAFVNAFIVREKRSRYLQFLASSKRRREILDRLNHTLDYDPALATRLPSEHQSADAVERLLKQKGAGATCHLIADSHNVDGQDLPLKEALTQAVTHDFGLIVCCVPGRLAFYKAEDIGHWYIFERKP